MCRLVQLSPTMVGWEGFEEDMAPMFEALRTGPGGPEHYRRFGDWLADNGVAVQDAERDVERFKNRPDRALALIPRALQPCADRVDTDRITFVGQCFGDRSQQGGWQRPAGADKVLLVSLGSAFTDRPAFYRSCVEAFGGLPGWHVVLQIGRHTDTAALGEV